LGFLYLARPVRFALWQIAMRPSPYLISFEAQTCSASLSSRLKGETMVLDNAESVESGRVETEA